MILESQNLKIKDIKIILKHDFKYYFLKKKTEIVIKILIFLRKTYFKRLKF